MRHPTSRVGGLPEAREWFRDPSLLSVPPEVHVTAVLQPYVTVDAGCERATTIGPRTVLMVRSHVGHDAIVGADCEIAPGAVICGYAVIGRGVKIGANAVINPYRMVGTNAQIGSGSVVTKDVPANEVWAGNPARRLR